MLGWWQRLWRREGDRGSSGSPLAASGQVTAEATGAGDEWLVVTAARLQETREGQLLEYPGRTVECPRGHRRVVPTRFDQPVTELRCAQCNRRYPFRQA